LFGGEYSPNNVVLQQGTNIPDCETFVDPA